MTTEAYANSLRELASLAGLHDSYRNAFGDEADVPDSTLAQLLAALGYPTDSEEAIAESRDRLMASRSRPVPPLTVVTADERGSLAVQGADGSSGQWSLADEAGETIERGIVRIEGEAASLPLPPLPLGYYRLTIDIGAGDVASTIISAPPKCWRPEPMPRIWGLSGPAYGLVSAGSLGMGDFSDIGAMAAAAGARGASFLTLSPIHALFSANRAWISPYSPSSRLFLDPIYIDPLAVEGLELEAEGMLAEARLDGRLTALQSGDLVDYAAVWELKRWMLLGLWETFQSRGGSSEFEAFRLELGPTLERHATFEAAAQAPDGTEPDPAEAEFQIWLQWVADIQLAGAQHRARDGGMLLGLLADLAVGANPDGSEVLSSPAEYISDASVGAPPDALAPQGQDWGLRALSPIAMEETGLSAFRALIRANMRHASGIRVDHAFQLRRLFLIPVGAPARDGAYLDYPADAMFAVLRVESHRAECLVIGEDLGTQPDGFHDIMIGSGVYGYRVLYFERGQDGEFNPPSAYPEMVQAVINTHDIATLEGWWIGRDIAERRRLGIIDDDGAENAARERSEERRRLLQMLASEGLLDDRFDDGSAPMLAVARALARSRADMVSFQLDDLAGAEDQQNVPGIVDGAPNWRRRLPMSIEELQAADGPLDQFAAAMSAEGRWPNAP